MAARLKRFTVGGNVTPKNLMPAWEPGKSGNPVGRPKGSRVRLGETFLNDLLADWDTHGAASIAEMREKSPGDYVKVVAATLPKELNVKVSELDELTDDQLARQLASIAAQLARAGIGAVEGTVAPVTPQSLN